MSAPSLVLLLLFVGAFSALVAGTLHYRRLTHLLRERDPRLWQELGRPSPSNKTIASGLAVWKVAWRPPDSVASDRELSSAFRTFLRIQVAGFICLGLGGAVFLFEIVRAVGQRAH